MAAGAATTEALAGQAVQTVRTVVMAEGPQILHAVVVTTKPCGTTLASGVEIGWEHEVVMV